MANDACDISIHLEPTRPADPLMSPVTRSEIRSTLTRFLFGLFLIATPVSADGENLRILRINPSGVDVPSGRQIVFQFDRPVVPVGRMDRTAAEIPISISPDPVCEWRWLNTSALACQLGEENSLAPATRYRIVIRPGLVAETGERMQAQHVHEFVTQRPSLGYYWFEEWRSPGTPRIQVTFDQPVRQESVAEHLYFGAPGGRQGQLERVPVTVEPVNDHGSSWTITPVEELPLATELALLVEPGIRSRLGAEVGIEDREVVVFNTFAEHRFLGIRCLDLENRWVVVEVEHEAARAPKCNPLGPVQLVFTSPVIKEVLQENLRSIPALAGGREDYDPWENAHSYSRLDHAPTSHRYINQLPEVLLAATEYRLRASAEALRDEFDRPLAQDIDFRFETDHRRPRFVLDHSTSTLERQVASHVPVVVTNLDRITARFDRFTAGGNQGATREVLDLPEAPDIAFRYPLPVRDWLEGESGAVVGHITTEPPEGRHWFFSQVTPFAVHGKTGFYNTLLWVTDLETGEPVSGARVEVLERVFRTLDGSAEALAQTVTDESGLAVLPGAAELDPERRMATRWLGYNKPHLVFRVTKGEDYGLLPLANDFFVRTRGPNEVYIPEGEKPKDAHLTAWGLTPQGIYRAGDEVDYKIYVRREGNRRLEPAPRGLYRLEVEDPQGKIVHERKDIELNAFGAFDGNFLVPKTGAVGWHRFTLRADFAKGESWEPLQLLVSDFTPASFRVTTELDAGFFRDGDEVVVASRAALHSGGPYLEAATRVTARVTPTEFVPSDPKLAGFRFATDSETRTVTVHQSEARTDERGELETRFDLAASAVIYGRLAVETAVRDDRGKYVAGAASAGFASRDRFVGIRQADWVLRSGEVARVEAVVADELGKGVAGATISIAIEHRKTTASRVKGAGNAYLTQYTHTWEAESSCELVSEDRSVGCEFTPEHAGSYRLTATTRDSQDREVSTSIWRWVVGKGQVLWEEPAGNHLQIEPEKETLRVGETARYLIKNPFPGAKALVTIERLGVIDKWIVNLDDSSEILEFEVKPDYLPGFYLSVVVTSPRVAPPPDDDRVDLGKPSFRMGYVQVPVRDPYKELRLEVTPSGEVFKPRETVSVEIRASDRQGQTPEMEFAVAVLDEAVFDLLTGGIDLFDPYSGLYRLPPLDVLNHNLLTALIGWQKFEQKGADAGGGGGDGALRSVFEFVSYWNPSVLADSEGRAKVEFEVPDNLTGWRVLVLAVTPDDYVGLGQATFKVNLPTEIRPALPNQVVEGDRFEARFTVMNRTDTKRKLKITGTASGDVGATPRFKATIRAEPFRRYTVGFPVSATGSGAIRFEIRGGDRRDSDGLVVSVPVRRQKALQAAATYGTTTENRVEEAVQFPVGIRTDVGRLSVVASPSVIGSLEGAFEYLREYPYGCWEQRLSQGVMAAHFLELRRYLDPAVTWDGAEALAGSMLGEAADFQAPSGGMAYWRPHDEYVSPYLSAYTALAFGWLRDLGYEIPSGVESRLHDYLGRLLRKDVFPDFYSKGMASSVRAVTLAALARAQKVTLLDLGRYRSHVPQMDLFGKAHYLQALESTAGTEEMRDEVAGAILAFANESGGKIVFSESLDDGYTRMLHSETRTNCSILSALALQSDRRADEGLSDLPFKLVRSITQSRGQRHHWENTQENMFCTRALIDYSREFEAVEPDMSVRVEAGGKSLGETVFDDPRDPAVEFERRITSRDPGTKTVVALDREGEGRLYYAVRLFYSPAALDARRINSGIDVEREYSVERNGAWVRLESPMRLKQGELVRVDLFVDLPAPRNYVVVDDPVPGGLEPVNRDLATASTVDADKAENVFPADSRYYAHDDWRRYAYTRWSFYHQELRHDSVRFYSDYLPAGRYLLSYVAQAIAPGEFTVLPLHVEEMYDPDVFGQGLPGKLRVQALP